VCLWGFRFCKFLIMVVVGVLCYVGFFELEWDFL